MLDLGKRGSETGEMSLLLAFCFFTMINTDTPGVWASLVAQSVKKLPAMQETCLGSPWLLVRASLLLKSSIKASPLVVGQL